MNELYYISMKKLKFVFKKNFTFPFLIFKKINLLSSKWIQFNPV